MDFLKTYLEGIKDISPEAKEHTYRTHLEILLNALKSELAKENKSLANINIKHEPNNDKEGRGAPDFQIIQSGLTIGYIENKRVNNDLDSVAGSPQIQKYLELNDNIMLTDYLCFVLIRKGALSSESTSGGNLKQNDLVKSLRICEFSELKSILKDKATLNSKAQELLNFFAIFYTHNPKPIGSALEFASALALRTQEIRTQLSEQHQENTHIKNLYHTFKKELYGELEYEDFCDSFAQTLTYSLFLARLNNASGEKIDLYNVKKFIPKSFPLIRSMSDFLDQLEDLKSIQWLLDEIVQIINHIDIASIVRELNNIGQKDLFGVVIHKDPYLHFYETFLGAYDPKLREARGVYYTPASVVHFIINSIDSVLKSNFDCTKGLGSALDSQTLTLLDFATGTGTFLLEAFRKALSDVNKKSPDYDPKVLLSRFLGFEFLIAPYTIAHLKLSQSFKEEFGSALYENERLGIYLTNTLYSKELTKEQNERANILMTNPDLVAEAMEAQKAKEKTILVITGNPPYSGASANKGIYEDEVRITYGLEPSLSRLSDSEQKEIGEYLKTRPQEKLKNLGNLNSFSIKDLKKKITTFKSIFNSKKLQNEKTTKWLLDDYVKFICFGESKIKSQKQGGIFAFISNNSFLDNPTFRGMRYSLLNTFDEIYILDLHGNTRKKECAPDGSKDENVFDIMQGVSVNVFIKLPRYSNPDMKMRNPVDSAPTLATIHHYDLYGKRAINILFSMSKV